MYHGATMSTSGHSIIGPCPHIFGEIGHRHVYGIVPQMVAEADQGIEDVPHEHDRNDFVIGDDVPGCKREADVVLGNPAAYVCRRGRACLRPGGAAERPPAAWRRRLGMRSAQPARDLLLLQQTQQVELLFAAPRRHWRDVRATHSREARDSVARNVDPLFGKHETRMRVQSGASDGPLMSEIVGRRRGLRAVGWTRVPPVERNGNRLLSFPSAAALASCVMPCPPAFVPRRLMRIP